MTVGRAAIIIAFVVSAYGVAAALYGVRAGRDGAVTSARRAVYALAGLCALAVAILELAYARTDLGFALVAQNSSTTTPTFYRLTALWSSQAGSLLLWVTVLSVFAALALRSARERHREIAPYANAVLAGLAAFFFGLMVFIPEANPFLAASPVPAEGAGLNPLLRHPSMMFHPPLLYSGYVGFSIPFAFAVGALVTRRLDAGWIRSTRRFALLAWTLLGSGIMLGARWSYSELGWGGYWGWDPVENASLLPWLVGTAFLHSIMVQERRGMLKVWNVSLIIGAFVLSLLGTFLVRSGILDSIHAFGASTLGRPFLAFITVVLLGSVGLVASRLPDLRSARRFDSLMSREAIFLVNNFLLVALAAVIFWGTFFPLISEAVTGTKASVGPPWFNVYIAPIAIALVLASGVGPIIPWGRMRARAAIRSFALPAVGAAVVAASVTLAAGGDPRATLLFAFGAFAVIAVVREFVIGARVRRSTDGGGLLPALAGLVRRNRRRYGGYVVHLGIAVVMFGVAASTAFDSVREQPLRVGERMRVGGYDVTYRRPIAEFGVEKQSLGAVVDVSRDGRHVATLRPARNFYPAAVVGDSGPIGRFFAGEATSEVGMRPGALRDLWASVAPDVSVLRPAIRDGNRLPGIERADVQAVVLAAAVRSYARRSGPVTVRFAVNPMVSWIWIGGVVMLIGALTSLWPAPGARRGHPGAAAAARRVREAANA